MPWGWPFQHPSFPRSPVPSLPRWGCGRVAPGGQGRCAAAGGMLSHSAGLGGARRAPGAATAARHSLGKENTPGGNRSSQRGERQGVKNPSWQSQDVACAECKHIPRRVSSGPGTRRGRRRGAHMILTRRTCMVAGCSQRC